MNPFYSNPRFIHRRFTLCFFTNPGIPFLALLMVTLPCFALAQQVPDTSFCFPLQPPAYSAESGPVVCIDEAHLNFHTISGGFLPFARLLRMDGYRVKPLNQPISSLKVLNHTDILVIANPIDASDTADWAAPNPSAFTKKEIETIRQWVNQGGSLFLIADHMPFAGAAHDLGKAFGFDFLNGFAFTRSRTWPPSVFKISDQTLMPGPVTSGNQEISPIDSVITFTGSAFRIPQDAIPVLVFHAEHYSLQPDTAWVFSEETPRTALEGYYQGALLEYGKGRVAVFGEAAMFTAQIANGTIKAGFNSEVAPQNAQFLLNVIHWLDGE
ncbi:MAG: DUF4350 domain-containing protein [Bacteroidales bacterium]|nr:DUF4350 domain-containing protein [Bacteroidales bacterium]